MLMRLFAPRRRSNQEEIAGRAAEVIVQVLFDVGLDRFFAGSFLLDREFRLHFYAVPPQSPGTVLASIPVHDLEEACMFRAHVLEAGMDARTLAIHAGSMADGVMRELRARSPAVCALPAVRRERRGLMRRALRRG